MQTNKCWLRLIEPMLCNQQYTCLTRHTFKQYLIKTGGHLLNQSPGLSNSRAGNNFHLHLHGCTHGSNAWETSIVLLFGSRNLMSISLVCPTSPGFTFIRSYLPQHCFSLNNCTDRQKVCLPLFIHLLKMPSLKTEPCFIGYFYFYSTICTHFWQSMFLVNHRNCW